MHFKIAENEVDSDPQYFGFLDPDSKGKIVE